MDASGWVGKLMESIILCSLCKTPITDFLVEDGSRPNWCVTCDKEVPREMTGQPAAQGVPLLVRPQGSYLGFKVFKVYLEGWAVPWLVTHYQSKQIAKVAEGLFYEELRRRGRLLSRMKTLKSEGDRASKFGDMIRVVNSLKGDLRELLETNLPEEGQAGYTFADLAAQERRLVSYVALSLLLDEIYPSEVPFELVERLRQAVVLEMELAKECQYLGGPR